MADAPVKQPLSHEAQVALVRLFKMEWQMFCEGDMTDPDWDVGAIKVGLAVRVPYDPRIHGGVEGEYMEEGDEITVLTPLGTAVQQFHMAYFDEIRALASTDLTRPASGRDG